MIKNEIFEAGNLYICCTSLVFILQLNARLRELQPLLNKPLEPTKQQVIGVLLEVKSAAEIKLLVSYIVLNAGWSPKYDLRVSSSERSMQVTYFGVVKQNTGEDW